MLRKMVDWETMEEHPGKLAGGDLGAMEYRRYCATLGEARFKA